MIEFTDYGWHGVISREITFENVMIVAQAICDMYNEEIKGRKKIVVAYDTRFLSREYAWDIQRVLTGNGLQVLFHKKPIPTFLLSYAVKQKKADLGVMVTGEERPARYSGIIFRDAKGCPMGKEWFYNLFNSLYRRYPRGIDGNKNLMEYIDVFDEYADAVIDYIDIQAFQQHRFTIAVDSFFGSAGHLVCNTLNKLNIEFIHIRGKPNPGFMDSIPYPTDKNMQPLIKIITEKKADAGFFFSGDGSSIGIVEKDGEILNFPLMSSIIINEWLEKRQGNEVICLGTTSPEAAYGLSKTRRIRNEIYDFDIFIDDCENKIIWNDFSVVFGSYLPVQDTILNMLLVLQALAKNNFDTGLIKKNIFDKTGFKYMDEKLVKIQREQWEKKKKEIVSNTRCINKMEIREIQENKDIKIIFKEGDWIVLRYNNEEEVLYIWAEGQNKDYTKNLIKSISKLIYN